MRVFDYGEARGASRWPLERDGGYAVGALVGGLGGGPEPPMGAKR